MHIWAYLHLAVCAIMEIQLQNAQFKGKTFEEYNLITEMSFLHAVLVESSFFEFQSKLAWTKTV